MRRLYIGFTGVAGTANKVLPLVSHDGSDYMAFGPESNQWPYTEDLPDAWTHERLVHQLAEAIKIKLRQSPVDELVLVGLSKGGVVAIDIAQRLKTTDFGHLPCRLVLVSAPFPGSTKTMVGSGKLARLLVLAGQMPRLFGWLMPAMNLGNQQPRLDREPGADLGEIRRSHEYAVGIPLRRYANEVASIIDRPSYGPGELTDIFDEVVYIGADNDGRPHDDVVDWRLAHRLYEAAFGQSIEVVKVEGWHTATANYPAAYEEAVRRLL